jgi:hypothetical protein
MFRSQTLIIILVGSYCLSSVKAFSVDRSQRRNIHLQRATRIDEQDSKPRWIELPTRARGDVPQLARAEITTGRIAMVGFFGLVAGEVVSGESFGQQILDAVMLATGH